MDKRSHCKSASDKTVPYRSPRGVPSPAQPADTRRRVLLDLPIGIRPVNRLAYPASGVPKSPVLRVLARNNAMKIPEHLALSYLLAQLGPHQTYGPAGTVLVMVAGMLPDLDG